MDNGTGRPCVMNGEQGNVCVVWCKKPEEEGHLKDLESDRG
jgi:hypothetical protein